METEIIQDTLISLGYHLSDFGDHWRTNAAYRDGDNPTALKIYKNSGVWTDFVEGASKSMPLKALVEKTLKTRDPKILKKYLKNTESTVFFQTQEKAIIEMDETYSEDMLTKLLPHYKFYNKKGISDDTLKFYRCGLATTGAMNNRFVFPVYNDHAEIFGFSGRHVYWKTATTLPKWKHIGRKTKWSYPLYLPDETGKFQVYESITKEKEVIIVESIGDSLALFENGIKNHLVTFGLDLSPSILTSLIALAPEKIVISTNNDYNTGLNRGLTAGIKAFLKLIKYFDIDKIDIKLPPKNDFGDMQERRIDFSAWANRETDKNKMYNHILNFIKQSSQKTLVSKSKIKLIESRIIK